MLHLVCSNADLESSLSALSAKCKECKGRIEGGVCAFNCSNTDLDCKETRDEKSVCCTQCSNADLECTKCKEGERASI